jgi:transglutaminase-like putative cysteine protease
MSDPLQKFLLPSKLINSDHPDIIRKAAELTAGVKRFEDKAKKIFYFIRDGIPYEFQAAFEEEEYLASEILKAGKGFCTQKAILFCALARHCGIPAGIHFYDIVDYTLPKNIVDILGTNTLYHHGIVELHLHGNWHRYDATLDTTLCSRRNRIPVEFDPDEDCLMKPKTRDGAKHIEYIRDYGLFKDISFEEILGWLKEDYPHIF